MCYCQRADKQGRDGIQGGLLQTLLDLQTFYFKAFDKDHDGFITKEEFAKIHKTMSPKQVDMEIINHKVSKI